MSRITRLAIVATIAVTGAAASGGLAFAQNDNDDEDRCRPAQTDAERRAARAAVDALGGGTALCVDREREGDVEWEVDVRLDGRRHEVELDGKLRVVEQEADDDRDDDQNDQDDND